MKDIEIAIKYLEKGNLAIVAVKDGELIFKSKEKGIKPMYILATEMEEISVGASIADRVIGKGAAMLCKHIGIEEVYGHLMSDSAMDVLKESNIKHTYNKSCHYIKNRDKTDMCPIEKIAIDVDSSQVLLERITEFMKNINK